MTTTPYFPKSDQNSKHKKKKTNIEYMILKHKKKIFIFKRQQVYNLIFFPISFKESLQAEFKSIDYY